MCVRPERRARHEALEPGGHCGGPVLKEIRQILRDGSSLLIGLLLPAVLIFIFGYGISLDLKNVPIAIVMEDNSPTARDALAGFRGTEYFSPVQASSMAEAEAMMRRREVDAILRIRNDFSANLLAGKASSSSTVSTPPAPASPRTTRLPRWRNGPPA